MTPNTDIEHKRTVTENGCAQASVNETVEEPNRSADAYQLYSYGFDGEPDSLVGSYDTLEETREKMRSISYDMDPGLFFYIMHGDEVVMGDPAARGQHSQMALSEVME